jgi:hypothetical protein
LPPAAVINLNLLYHGVKQKPALRVFTVYN